MVSLSNENLGTQLNSANINSTIAKYNRLATNVNGFINKSILVDLSPIVTYGRWANVINNISVPVLTVSGNHPTGIEMTSITKKILKGLDDGVVNIESSSGRNMVDPANFSTQTVLFKKQMFDKGIPKERAKKFYKEERMFWLSNTFFVNSSPFTSATGMVYPPSIKNLNSQFNNHYIFLQAADQHMIGD